MKRKSFLLLPVFVLSLASCSEIFELVANEDVQATVADYLEK